MFCSPCGVLIYYMTVIIISDHLSRSRAPEYVDRIFTKTLDLMANMKYKIMLNLQNLKPKYILTLPY